MKRLLFFMLLVVSACSVHNHLAVPAVQFQWIGPEINPYVKILHLKDSNALILKVAETNVNNQHAGNFLVKDKKGSLTYYALILGYGHDTILYSKKIKKNDVKSLDSAFIQTTLINKDTVEDYSKMQVYDAGSIDLELYQNRYYSKIRANALQVYIQENMGTEERKKMINVVEKLSRYKHLPGKKFSDIEKYDTIYIHFTYGNLQAKEPRFKSIPQKQYTFYTGRSSMNFFFQKGNDSLKVPRSFLKTHSNQIVDYFFFLKNNAYYLGFRKRTIILIDDNGKDLYLKNVIYGSL